MEIRVAGRARTNAGRARKTARVRGVRKDRADPTGPRGIPFAVHADRSRIDWERLRGGSDGRDPSSKWNQERPGGCWAKQHLWHGRAARQKRVGSALAGSI